MIVPALAVPALKSGAEEAPAALYIVVLACGAPIGAAAVAVVAFRFPAGAAVAVGGVAMVCGPGAGDIVPVPVVDPMAPPTDVTGEGALIRPPLGAGAGGGVPGAEVT